MIGKNTITEPTPPTIPSIIKDLNQGDTLAKGISIRDTKLSLTNLSANSCKGPPTQSKVNLKIINIIPRNIG